MARTTAIEIKPWQQLTAFLVLTVAIFAAVFFTGDHRAAPKLGIDLQGGTRVVLTPRTVDGGAPDRGQLEQARNVIENRVNGLGVAGAEVIIAGDNIQITVPGTDGQAAKDVGQPAKMSLRPVVTVQPQSATAPPNPAPASGEVLDPDATAKAIADAKKLREADDAKALEPNLAKVSCVGADPLRGNDDPKKFLISCGMDDGQVYLLGPEVIPGADISDATSGLNQQGQNTVDVSFSGGAGRVWGDFTTANVGKQVAFVLDTAVLSAPVIQQGGQYGGSTSITGQFTPGSARSLANVIKSGALPLSFELSDAQTVSATLGFSSLRAGLLAGLVGLILVFLYALGYYRMLGILTVLSLVLSGLMTYGLLVLLGRWIGYSLDLAGIAGLIIGIGMTADSFVVYFERIKDEMRVGRSFRSAVPRGWQRAKRTIFSGNAVSFIAAAVLYALAIGEVRGFAFTLGLSTILDVVIVVMVTHPLVTYASRNALLSRPSVNGLGAITAVGREARAAAVDRRNRDDGDDLELRNGSDSARATKEAEVG